MTNEEIIQKLNDMQTILMERGWGKVELENPHNGNVCLLGARNIAMGRSNEIPDTWEDESTTGPYQADEVSEALVDAILNRVKIMCTYATSTGSATSSVYAWNDTYAQDLNDVLDLIDDAIIKQKEQM